MRLWPDGSSDSAQNNLSKAIDDVERDWDAGVDYMERSMDNMDNTDRNNSGYGVTSRDNLCTSGFTMATEAGIWVIMTTVIIIPKRKDDFIFNKLNFSGGVSVGKYIRKAVIGKIKVK